MPNPAEDKVMALVRRSGVLRPRDLAQHDISRQYLLRLESRGEIKNVGRGLDIATETRLTVHHSLVEASKRVPRGIICLLSALRCHGLTTQSPSEVWIAIDNKAWRPGVDKPRLHIVRFSKEALTSGIEGHVIEKVHVRV
jgi:predicted transcriptional regulator of viral defense system